MRKMRFLLVGLAVLGSACDGGASGGAPQAPEAAGESVTQSPDPAAFCEALSGLLDPGDDKLGIDPDTADASELVQASREWYGSDEARGLMDEAQRVAPADIADDFEIMKENLISVAEGTRPTTPPKVTAAAQERVQAYRLEECPQE